jgi:hypothetical protein
MTRHHPQRILHFAPPGSLLKRNAAATRPQPRPDDGHTDTAYLAQVRALNCLKCGMEPSEAAHVRYASTAHGKASGMQKRPADRWALPLCAGCHRLARHNQHSQGERQFWDAIDINPLMVCAELYAVRGDLVAMQAVITKAIAGRGR